MARRRNRGAMKAPASNPAQAKTGDSFQNLTARVGLGAQNQNSASGYAFSPVSRNRIELENCYRSSWIAGMAVDCVASDMTREGIDIRGDIEPDRLEQIGEAFNRLQIWKKLNDTIKWARLYGGCVAVLMIDGQDPATPLRLDTIAEGQFKGLLPLDRWRLQPSLTDLVKDFGPEIGMPRFYDWLADENGTVGMKIHHSRLIRIDGVDLPFWQRIAENGWGMSVLERLWDRLIPYDSTTQGAAQLVYKAHLRTYKVKGLREIISVGGRAFEGLVKQIEMIRTYQSNEGMTLMDAEDEFEAHQYSFSGLSDLMLQFGQQISGAIGVPMVRLFGQAPAGLGGEHEGELRNYYDDVKKEQESKLRPGMTKVLDAVYRSEFGEPMPDGVTFEFSPLWQMGDSEKADVANKITTAVIGAYDAQVIDRATALKELRQSSQVTGVFTNVTDEDIDDAENDPPPMMGEMGVGGLENENLNLGSEAPESGAGKAGRKVLLEETQEPR